MPIITFMIITLRTVFKGCIIYFAHSVHFEVRVTLRIVEAWKRMVGFGKKIIKSAILGNDSFLIVSLKMTDIMNNGSNRFL